VECDTSLGQLPCRCNYRSLPASWTIALVQAPVAPGRGEVAISWAGEDAAGSLRVGP
jgi:hypothetical protein